MKKVKVVLDFVKFPVVEKIAFYRTVISQLTDNAVYATPDVALADAKTAVNSLETPLVLARDGSHTAISTMHDNDASADTMFRLLAAYVDRMAAADETKILSSGFHASKQPVSSQKATLSVNDGVNSGSVKLVAKAVEKAGAYLWQYAKDTLPETDSDWTMAGTGTRANYDLAGLAVAAKYYFRVAAITPDGTSDYSASVSKIVI